MNKALSLIVVLPVAWMTPEMNGLQAGLNAHLSKPVEPESLFSTLESLIKEK
ncbi:MAG: hypothetical protein IIZ64_08785 [Erysipelotrichaceae bacterium]|nr:hypothetical protein [Erysipelotrichaceae bacterium]